jgi:hypothetical protein
MSIANDLSFTENATELAWGREQVAERNGRFLILFLHVLISPFKTKWLEVDVLLRHQLSVLRRAYLGGRSRRWPTDCSSSGSTARFRRC